MSSLAILGVFIGLLFLLMFLGVPVAASLGLCGIVTSVVFLKQFGIAQHVPFQVLTSFVLIAVPLFVFMGEVMLRTGTGELLYDGAATILKNVPGGLLHANIVSCAIFSCISGSSVACAATVGTVAIPELEARGYDRKLTYGSLAAGGTLGILIPPSIGFIVYGAAVGQSVGRLFIAGILPGILLSSIFIIYIMIRVALEPNLAPRGSEKQSFGEKALKIAKMWPIAVIIIMTFGGLYLGIMTPTEVAAVGATLALIFGLLYRRLTWSTLRRSLLDTVQTTSFIMFIIIGAQIMSAVVALLHLPDQMVVWIGGMDIPPVAILLGIYVLYLILGCFMDGLSMLVLTMPFVYPLITRLGYDPIWFGVVYVVLVEIGLLTPPVGINVFTIHGLVPHRPLSEVFAGSTPFFLLMIFCLAILTAFPEIATWLPTTMMRPVG